MRKILMLTLVLVIAACLQAQDASTVTLQGCLSYGKHHYRLTDSSGAQHQLSGYSNKLKPLIGHEVEITGTEGVHTTGTTVDGQTSTRSPSS
jgi:hypothetical protein